MLAFGILSIVQIIFIPGFILLSHLKLMNLSLLGKLLYIFGLSLFLNYVVVVTLTLAGIYTLTVFQILFTLELIYILYLVTAKKHITIFNKSIRDYFNSFIFLFKQEAASNKIILCLTSILVLFYFSLLLVNIGTIFFFVDPANLIHLNTWAIDFANNTLPKQTSHFPQLIPANWSISYLMIDQSNIQLFPKFFMPLFFFGNLMIFVDLSISKKTYVYLLGLIIYGLFAPIIYSLVFIADGSADLPVSFFAFLTFYTFLKIQTEKFVLKDHIIFFLFASITAATKLAGFYTFALAGLYSLYILYIHRKSVMKYDFLIIVLFLLSVIPISHFWYLLKPETMYSGLHQPQWLPSISYAGIFLNALEIMFYNWGLPVFAFFVITILSSLFVKDSRYVALFMVIPPIIIWMFKFSSDFRNLSFVIPFLCFASAFGLINIVRIALNKPVNLKMADLQISKINISAKQIILGLLISVLSVFIYLIINADFSYKAIYDIYKFISINYFQSYRINLLIDYTPFINVDYYQKVFGIMFLLVPTVFLFLLLKIKVKHVLIVLGLVSLALNFTLLKKVDIINHQKNWFEVIEARNYVPLINTIVTTAELDKKIYSNFRAIAEQRNFDNLKFAYINENELRRMLTITNTETQYFLKLDLLSPKTMDVIDILRRSGDLNILFDDGKFIFFTYN